MKGMADNFMCLLPRILTPEPQCLSIKYPPTTLSLLYNYLPTTVSLQHDYRHITYLVLQGDSPDTRVFDICDWLAKKRVNCRWLINPFR